MAKVSIKSDERAALCNAGVEYVFVGRAGKSLLANRRNIITIPAQKCDSVRRDVLIHFYLHALGSTGTGMTLSRAASAP